MAKKLLLCLCFAMDLWSLGIWTLSSHLELNFVVTIGWFLKAIGWRLTWSVLFWSYGIVYEVDEPSPFISRAKDKVNNNKNQKYIAGVQNYTLTLIYSSWIFLLLLYTFLMETKQLFYFPYRFFLYVFWRQSSRYIADA